VTTPNDKLDAMLTDFEKRTATDPNHPGQNLRNLLNHSPDLKTRFLESAGQDHLKRFDALPANAHAGGTYNSDTKSMELPQDTLGAAGKSKPAAAELVFVMGHEIQHSFNSNVTEDATKKFIDDVNKTAKSSGPHDYTAAIDTLIQTNRRDEASANIGGFNALASQVQKGNPKATLEDFYKARPERMGDFIERNGTRPHFTYELKPGLSVDKHMHMDASKDNVEAMGKYYFDKTLPPHQGLGPKGDQNYHNYYGNWALNYVDSAERSVQAAHASDPKYVAPKVDVDLQKIGLDKTQLDTTLKYTDTSPGHQPAKPVEAVQAPKGPFGDPALDHAFHAMQAGNDARVTQAAQQLQNSPDGQRLAQVGNHLLAEQQRQEPPAQTQAPAQPFTR
jgi:hypothetical protein